MAKEWFSRKSITLKSEKIDLNVRLPRDVKINNVSVITTDAFTKTSANSYSITPNAGTIVSITQLDSPISSTTFLMEARKIGEGLIAVTIPRFKVNTFSNSGSVSSVRIHYTGSDPILLDHYVPILLTQAENDYLGCLFVESGKITITFVDPEFSFADSFELKGNFTFIIPPVNV